MSETPQTNVGPQLEAIAEHLMDQVLDRSQAGTIQNILVFAARVWNAAVIDNTVERIAALDWCATSIHEASGMPLDQARHDVAVIAENFSTLGYAGLGLRIERVDVQPEIADVRVEAWAVPI